MAAWRGRAGVSRKVSGSTRASAVMSRDSASSRRPAAPSAAKTSTASRPERNLGRLDVPVAELVPGELVEPHRRVVEAMGIERLAYLGGRPLEPRQDPALRQGSVRRPLATRERVGDRGGNGAATLDVH